MSEDDSVKHEGKWTRADLPSWDKIRDADDMAGNGLRSRVIDIALNEVVYHLNAHHPKPAPDLLSSAAECVLDAEDRVRSAKAERDAAVTRAEQAEDQWKKWEHKANEWKARAEAAEARTAPAVTCEHRDAVADHLWNAMVGSAKSVVRDVVAQAFVAAGIEVAVEVEPTVDLIEEKAIELHRVAYGGRIGFGHATLNAQEMFRSLARHVLGQEAGDE